MGEGASPDGDRATLASPRAPTGLGHSEGIPSADGITPTSIPCDWQNLDVEDAEEAFGAFAERLRREMAGHQKCASRLRKDAADALEQAAAHDERAAEFWNVINALQRAPLTFPAKGMSAGTAETAQQAQGEARQPGAGGIRP